MDPGSRAGQLLQVRAERPVPSLSKKRWEQGKGRPRMVMLPTLRASRGDRPRPAADCAIQVVLKQGPARASGTVPTAREINSRQVVNNMDSSNPPSLIEWSQMQENKRRAEIVQGTDPVGDREKIKRMLNKNPNNKKNLTPKQKVKMIDIYRI